MSGSLLKCLALSLLAVSSEAFKILGKNAGFPGTLNKSKQVLRTIPSRSYAPSRLHAKKAQTESKGFSPKKVKIVRAEVDQSIGDSSSLTTETRAESPKKFESETDADAIFKKYGIKDGDSNKTKSAAKKKPKNKNKKGEPEETPFGQSVLAGIPADTQMKIDNTLVTCVSLSLGFVVLSGISISLGAYTVVFPDVHIPEWLDGLITNFLSPAFTPALGIFFFFSTTFGLFKFAQISSDQTVYKEEVTRDL